MAAGRLYRLFLVFPGCSDLGVYQRNLPEPRARKGPKPWQLFTLVYECGRVANLPGSGSIVSCSSIRVLRRNGSAAVFRSAVLVPRNAGRVARRHAEAAWHRMITSSQISTVRR